MSLTNTKVDGSDFTQPISAVSLPLPTGASTEATLATLLTTAAFQARVNTFGQKTMANSTPVTIASDQSAIPVSQSGSWTVAGTGNFTVVQSTGTNLHTVLDSGTLTSITNALPAGSNVIGHIIADSGSTTVVTGNVTVVQPTGTNLHTVVDSGTITVTQSTSPWVSNITQFGSSNVVTGVGASGSGIPRITVANDSSIKITDGTDTLLVNTDGSISVVPVPIGTHGNAWNAATVSSGGNSNVIDCQFCSVITIFGNVSNNLNPIRLQASQDNSNFFTVTTISASAGNFGVTVNWGARYMRLQSGQGTNFTITATIAGK